jgi:cellulose synthase/poly-beta-1,6-N-acetylglucosamine synthase-like glycosyltransferase
MRIVFWLSLAVVLYTYIGYPVMIWLLSRVHPRSWMRAPINHTVSIIMAVRNGAAYLPNKIQTLFSIADPSIKEIIVVSDGSTDGTLERLSSCTEPRLRCVKLEQHCGKAVALNAGIAAASSDLLVFLDIRPQIRPESLSQLVSNFADPAVGCAAGELDLLQNGHDLTTRVVSSMYWRYEQWIRRSEAAWDSPVGVYGGFYAVRRELATSFPAGTILDDMFQPLAIIRQGYRSVLDPNARVYDTWPKRIEGEFHRKVRTLAGNFQLFELAPWVLTTQNRVMVQLISHKALRLIVPYLLILLLVSSLLLSWGSPLYASFAALQLILWAIASLSMRYTIPVLSRLGGPASALLILNGAAVVALHRFVFAHRQLWKIWTAPPTPGELTPAESEATSG